MNKDDIKVADRATIEKRMAEVTPTLTDANGKVSGEVFTEIRLLRERLTMFEREDFRSQMVEDASKAQKRADKDALVMNRPEVKALSRLF
jgi:hypothetical protein